MKPIQFILVPLLIILLVIFFPKLRKQWLIRSVFVGIIALTLLFTIYLDSSTIIAQYLGIGRGVDLVLYFGMLGLTVCCLMLYLRSLKLEQMITQLAREQALAGKEEKQDEA